MKKNQERRLHRKNAKIAKEGGTPMTLNRPIKPDTTVMSPFPLFFFFLHRVHRGTLYFYSFPPLLPSSVTGGLTCHLSIETLRTLRTNGSYEYAPNSTTEFSFFFYPDATSLSFFLFLFRNEPQVSTLGGVQHRRAAAISCYTVHTNCGSCGCGVRIRGHTTAVDAQPQQFPWLGPEHLTPRAFTLGDEPTCCCRRTRRGCAAGRAQDQTHFETVILAHPPIRV
jgi:hypothetical protein